MNLSRAWILLTLTGALLLPSPPAGAEEAAKLAAELARLRGEVEALTAELDAKKEGLRAQLRSLAAQKTDLDIELQKEELRLKQLRQSKAQQQARIRADDALRDILRPVAKQALSRLEAVIAAGLPFKVEARLKELERLERQLDEGLLRPPNVVARLWQSVEDELRMARENGVFRQVIRLGGEEKLVEVARIGMAMLYFRTKDDEYGRAIRGPDGWRFRAYAAPAQREQLALLFDSFKKRIRVGWFELPNALPTAEVQ